MLTLSMDRRRISSYLKASVTVTSDTEFDAVEVRATKVNDPYMKGFGYGLLCDDRSNAYYCENGVVYINEPVTSFSFDIEAEELADDGDYRISVYVRNSDGVWNDVCNLYTNSSQQLVDSNGACICSQRSGMGTDEGYISMFSGEEIDNFISEVLRK